MHKHLALAVATVLSATALTTGLPAFAQAPAPETQSCLSGVSAISKDIKAGFAHKFWRHGPDQQMLTQARQSAQCLSTSSRKKIQQIYKSERSSFRTYRTYRHIATIPGFHEGDEYLAWLPIPRYIVACETQGRTGEGRWTAQNPSTHAQGPAQLNGWPAPNPARTDQQKLAYWEEVVHGPLQSQGLSAWSCA